MLLQSRIPAVAFTGVARLLAARGAGVFAALLATAVALFVIAAQPARATQIIPVTSPGGISAWLVEAPDIPILSIEVEIAGGALLDPAGREGVSNMVMNLLQDGAGHLDALAFAGATQDLGTGFGFSSGRDSVGISAAMLSENRDQSIDLLALALRAPRFDEDAVDRIRQQILSSIRSDETNPDSIAGRAFIEAAYAGHPYARPGDGTAASVAAITVDDLRAAHAAALVRDRMVVGVVGDITAAELGPLLDRLFGWMPTSGPSLPPVAAPNDFAGITVIPFTSPQSVARFGHSGIARQDPDYIAAYVASQILSGGGSGSRLTDEVREKRGLTYGVYSYLASNRFGPLVMGGLDSANETMAEALDVIRAEWVRIATEGVTEKELTDAKRYLTGAYPLRFDGNAQIASILVGLQMAGLDAGYVARRNDMIMSLSLDEVNAAAARVYRPENLRVVVVGTPDGLPATQ